MNNLIKLSILLFLANSSWSQSYHPAAGQMGSSAIHKDSSIIVDWATTCVVERGPMDISNPGLGLASFGDQNIAVGPASGSTTSVVSLGDGGIATLTFSAPITNQIGPDFAVFENGLSDTFLELAFVEVSSDGERFIRFPAISEIPSDVQIGGFGAVDCRYIHNFAGKYRVGFGTPFDLEDLIDSTGIDINSITHIRIVDIIGTINPTYATYDSQGNITNDPYPTPFNSGGFDLDGVAVLKSPLLSINKNELSISIFPNPTTDKLNITTFYDDHFIITNLVGEIVVNGVIKSGINSIDLTQLNSGIYILNTHSGQSFKFVKK